MVNIRQANENDLDGIMYVESIAWEPYGQATRETMVKRMRLFPYGFFVAEDKSIIVGYMTSYPMNYSPDLSDLKSLSDVDINFDENGNTLYLLSMGILPEYRKRHVGEQLVYREVELAKSRNMVRVLGGARWIVRDFFNKCEFSIGEPIPGFWPEDEASEGVGVLVERRLK